MKGSTKKKISVALSTVSRRSKRCGVIRSFSGIASCSRISTQPSAARNSMLRPPVTSMRPMSLWSPLVASSAHRVRACGMPSVTSSGRGLPIALTWLASPRKPGRRARRQRLLDLLLSLLDVGLLLGDPGLVLGRADDVDLGPHRRVGGPENAGTDRSSRRSRRRGTRSGWSSPGSGVELAAQPRHPPAVKDVGRVEGEQDGGVDRDHELVVGEDVGEGLGVDARSGVGRNRRVAGLRVRVLVAPDPLLADRADRSGSGRPRGRRRCPSGRSGSSWRSARRGRMPRRRSPCSRRRRRRRRSRSRVRAKAAKPGGGPVSGLGAGAAVLPRRGAVAGDDHQQGAVDREDQDARDDEHHPVDRGDVVRVRRVSGFRAQQSAASLLIPPA